MRILIVDDELVSRIKMRKIMENLGTSENVRNGIQAISEFKMALDHMAPFELVTLDIEMPEMDGTEVLYQIRKIESQRNVPEEKQVKILMVTSQADKGSVFTSIQAGCDNYIIKPFDKKSIYNKLKEMGFNIPEPTPREGVEAIVNSKIP